MPRVRCFVRACKNASYKKDSSCSFHDFPLDKKLREKWLAEIMKYEKSCGRSEWLRNDPPKITAHSKMCSDHFEKQCFLDFSKMKRLNPTAVPTIFPSPLQSGESVKNSGTSAVNSHFLEEQRKVEIFGSDHTYGRTVIQPVQQQNELQPIEVVLLEDSSTEDDLIPLARARTDTRSMTPPIRAPYDLTGRMVEEPEKTLPVNRIPASEPTVTLPTPVTSSDQGRVLVTCGQTAIQRYIAQQQKEIQAVLSTSEGTVTKGGGIPRIDTASVTRPRAPYDLTGRMVEEPEKTLAVNRISASKPAVTLPTPTTSGNQVLLPHGRTVTSILPKCGGSVTNRGSGGIPIQRARIDTPSVPRRIAPYDLTARMVEEPEKTLAVNRISGFQPAPALPISTPASNQDFVILFTPQPTIPAALPVQNTNYYLVPTPVASSVVASKAGTGISDNQQNQQQRVEERIVDPNPGTCKPKKNKEVTQKAIKKRNAAYEKQRQMVRKLKRRVEQMERTYAKLLNTVGFALYERSQKDIRVKRMFRSIEAMLSGDDNGEDHPAFLIDQILNFNAKTAVNVKYSQATMRSATTLSAKSSSTYEFIRNQGVLILPTRQTLAKNNTKKVSVKEDVAEEETDALDGLLTLHTAD